MPKISAHGARVKLDNHFCRIIIYDFFVWVPRLMWTQYTTKWQNLTADTVKRCSPQNMR